jgi:hypothetical protein
MALEDGVEGITACADTPPPAGHVGTVQVGTVQVGTVQVGTVQGTFPGRIPWYRPKSSSYAASSGHFISELGAVEFGLFGIS